MNLIWLTICKQTERCITCYFSLMFLACFVLSKYFWQCLSDLINSIFKRKNASKLIQLSIRISKIGHFSLTFKCNEKKVPFKKFFKEESYKKIFSWGEVWSLKGGWKYLKNRGLIRKRWKKKRREGCDPQRNYAIISKCFVKLSIIKY